MSSSASSFTDGGGARGARVERLALDGLARTIALATLPNTSHSGGGRSVVVMILEPGGGVTVAEGLSRPTRHMINTLPSRLRGARTVIDALRGEAVRLFWSAATAAGGGRRAWATALADAFLVPTGPLDWSDDASELAAAWARRWIAGADPLVPDLHGSRPPRSSSHLASFLSPPAPASVAAVAVFAHATAAPAPLIAPALYWSPQWCALNVDAAALEAVGFAWQTTSSSGLPSPTLSLWPFACDQFGTISWTRLPDDTDDADAADSYCIAADSLAEATKTRNFRESNPNPNPDSLADSLASAQSRRQQSQSQPRPRPSKERDPRCERTRALLRSAGWLTGAGAGGDVDDDEGGPGAGGFRGLLTPLPDNAHRSLPVAAVPALHARGALRAGARAAAELVGLGPFTAALAGGRCDARASALSSSSVSLLESTTTNDRPIAWASWAEATTTANHRDDDDPREVTVTHLRERVTFDRTAVAAAQEAEYKEAEYNYRSVRAAAASALAATTELTLRLRGQGL